MALYTSLLLNWKRNYLVDYKVEITDDAKKEILSYRKSGAISATKKIHRLIEELKVHPKSVTGKPEQLKYHLSGLWSMRIDYGNRLVYSIEDNIVTVRIISAKGHYI